MWWCCLPWTFQKANPRRSRKKERQPPAKLWPSQIRNTAFADLGSTTGFSPSLFLFLRPIPTATRSSHCGLGIATCCRPITRVRETWRKPAMSTKIKLNPWQRFWKKNRSYEDVPNWSDSDVGRIQKLITRYCCGTVYIILRFWNVNQLLFLSNIVNNLSKITVKVC